MKTPKFIHLLFAISLTTQTLNAVLIKDKKNILNKTLNNICETYTKIRKICTKYPKTATTIAISSVALTGVGGLFLAEKYLSKRNFALLAFGLGATAVAGITFRKEIVNLYKFIYKKLHKTPILPEKPTYPNQNNTSKESSGSKTVITPTKPATVPTPTAYLASTTPITVVSQSGEKSITSAGRVRLSNTETNRKKTAEETPSAPQQQFNQWGTYSAPAYNPEATSQYQDTPFSMFDEYGNTEEYDQDGNPIKRDCNGNIIVTQTKSFDPAKLGGKKLF